MPEENQPLVSIVIVNFNTGSILRMCIESLYEYETEMNPEIIIVDNNSNDDSVSTMKEIESQYPNVCCISLDRSVSFSEANNIGIDYAKGEFVLIMNPDIIFTGPVLSGLTASLKANNLSAVCPSLVGQDAKFQNRYFQRFPSVLQYVLFYSLISKLFSGSVKLSNRYLCNEDITTSSEGIQITEQIPCAFLLTTREYFDKCGKMDERFKLFFEDVDLCYRLKKFGRIAVDASCRVIHLGGSSFKTTDDYWLYGRFIISMLTFFRKNYSSFRYFALKTISVINSYTVLFLERFSFRDEGESYRQRKHRYFLNELRKSG